ncbi:MAG: class I SAM-dependent methyltransferase [Pseudomonadota bacterium]
MFSAEKERIRGYWNGRAAAYSREFGHGFFDGSEPTLWSNLLQRNLPVRPGAQALDLGTGPGFMALTLHDLGFRVTALDVSEEMLKVAADNAARRGATVEFRQGDAENPPFAPESFDLVICRHLTWTLTNLPRSLSTWKGLLRPDGVLAVIDGVWGSSTGPARVRRLAADAVKALKDKKWPGDWRKSYVSDTRTLPYLDGLQPELVVEALAARGFENIRHDPLPDVIRHERRFAPLEYRIRHFGSPRYLIAGTSTSRGGACASQAALL